MRRIALVAFAIALILSLCSCELSLMGPAPSKGRMHILVYGNDYSYGSYVYYEDGTKVPGSAGRLKGTVNDAYQVGLALCALAKKAGSTYDATLIIGQESRTATDPNITVVNDVYKGRFLSQLDDLASGTSEDDITIIYYSGHGLGNNDKLKYGSDPSTDSYMAFRRDDTTTILYPISSFLSKIDAIKGDKVILGDFCYSGAMVMQGNVSVTTGEYAGINATGLLKLRDDITQSPSVYCLSAARYFEKSWEPGDGSHGYFTEALLKGLGWDEDSQTLKTAAAQKNGMITLFNLARYVTAHDGTAKQTPMTSGGSGDIILFSF